MVGKAKRAYKCVLADREKRKNTTARRLDGGIRRFMVCVVQKAGIMKSFCKTRKVFGSPSKYILSGRTTPFCCLVLKISHKRFFGSANRTDLLTKNFFPLTFIVTASSNINVENAWFLTQNANNCISDD
uniref:Uncharacterized protein n=1 Tax=Romanomermis culicivorax TaxID=13658 RepID=A0A915IKF0_ROMCU